MCLTCQELSRLFPRTGLIGFESVNLNTNAIAEAAPVDVVIVLDISGSMASDTIAQLQNNGYPDVTLSNYNPIKLEVNFCI